MQGRRDLIRIAVVASPTTRNRPQSEKYFDFDPLHPPDQIATPRSQFLSIFMVKAVKSTYHMQGRRDLIRIAVFVSLTTRNRPQNEKYFDFVPLHPPDQIAPPRSQFLSDFYGKSSEIHLSYARKKRLNSDCRRLIADCLINHRTKSISILHLCTPRTKLPPQESILVRFRW